MSQTAYSKSLSFMPINPMFFAVTSFEAKAGFYGFSDKLGTLSLLYTISCHDKAVKTLSFHPFTEYCLFGSSDNSFSTS